MRPVSGKRKICRETMKICSAATIKNSLLTSLERVSVHARSIVPKFVPIIICIVETWLCTNIADNEVVLGIRMHDLF